MKKSIRGRKQKRITCPFCGERRVPYHMNSNCCRKCILPSKVTPEEVEEFTPFFTSLYDVLHITPK